MDKGEYEPNTTVTMKQTWQQFRHQVGDAAPVELPAEEITSEDGTTILPIAPPSPEQPSVESTPEPDA